MFFRGIEVTVAGEIVEPNEVGAYQVTLIEGENEIKVAATENGKYDIKLVKGQNTIVF